jgi:hypothetical protein
LGSSQQKALRADEAAGSREVFRVRIKAICVSVWQRVPVCKSYGQSVRVPMLRLGDPGLYPIVYYLHELVFGDQLLGFFCTLRANQARLAAPRPACESDGGESFFSSIRITCCSVVPVACFVRDRFSPPNVPKLSLASADLSIRIARRFVRVIAKSNDNAATVAVFGSNKRRATRGCRAPARIRYR